MEQFGNGQPVQHLVTERNVDWHMVKTVEPFQAVNWWEVTNVIVVDKDLKKIEVYGNSDWLADTLFAHYQFAWPSDDTADTFVEQQHIVHVCRDGRVHRVDTNTWLCDYDFYVTINLPCRHLLLFQKHLRDASQSRIRQYILGNVHEFAMWLRTSALDDEIAAIEVLIIASKCRDDVKMKNQMTERDKYKHAQEVFSRITTELNYFPDVSNCDPKS
ncbi:unnamed protein product [Phytophthora fragariaefolia]|uniref:Unnamed protein product n=1 Tax=Phytophthora fragariaefolia TaxID=1490495 RepID=A0A9W6YF35_9STRA|nr:unnamed protein product [Phytophthora fragariaefolia]